MSKKQARPALLSRGAANTAAAKPFKGPRSILTTVRKKRDGQGRINWKRCIAKYGLYVILLTTTVTTGAGIFAGLQKASGLDEELRCTDVKEKIKGSLKTVFETCQMGMDGGCLDKEEKRIATELRKACYRHPSAAMKPINTMGRGILYTFTFMATIGYGNIAAVTPAGKIMTMVFAVGGFAFFMAYVNHFARWFQIGLLLAYEQLRRCTGGGKNFQLMTDKPEDGRVFLFSVAVFLTYTSLVSAFYSLVQKWSFWRSFYFAYQSVSMIGFGDVAIELEDPAFIMMHIVFTIIGIIMLAVCAFPIREFWANVVERLAQRYVPDPVVPVVIKLPGDDIDDTMKDISVILLEGQGKRTGGSPRYSPKTARLKKTAAVKKVTSSGTTVAVKLKDLRS